jgi:hypothetical protein
MRRSGSAITSTGKPSRRDLHWGEFDKPALNIDGGRNRAGIHWRSDAAASTALGERAAIGLLRDMRMTVGQTFNGFSFTRFDGCRVTV